MIPFIRFCIALQLDVRQYPTISFRFLKPIFVNKVVRLLCLFVCLFIFVLFVCVCVVCAWVGNFIPLSSIYLILIYVKPHQMPPRVDPTQRAIQQLLAAQAQMMQIMGQYMQNNNNPPPQQDVLIKFLKLGPPIYSRFSEPSVADNWVNTVNKSLVIIGCTDAEKVKLVAHLLKGPVATWWKQLSSHSTRRKCNMEYVPGIVPRCTCIIWSHGYM